MLSFASGAASAFEFVSSNPGTRAMGMAGVFVGQADDSSAVWYNPAGLKLFGVAKKDITIEVGEVIEGKKDATIYADQYALKYLSAYINDFPPSRHYLESIGIGVAYYSPFSLEVDVDAPASPVDSSPFGVVNVDYNQLSAFVSKLVYKDFAIGVAADTVWTDINCVVFTPCVDNGPMGFGLSVGAMHNIWHTPRYALTAGALWRSQALIRYQSRPQTGLGSVLSSYLPDRPESITLGLNLQVPSPWLVSNINLMVEQVQWADAAGANYLSANYDNAGVGAEFLLPVLKKHSLAIRYGFKKGMSKNTNIASDVSLQTFGFGFSLAKHHFFDLASERRASRSAQTSSARLFSMSYSWQY